jgi:hypothetical protein
MPTLPSFEQLGLVTPQPAQGPMLSPQVAQETAEAGAQLGESTAKAGYDISRADYYEGNMQRSYAEANVRNGMESIRQDIMSDPTKYATASDRYQQQYQSLLNTQAQAIDDPVQRQKFTAQATSMMALGQKQIDIFARAASNQDQLSKYDIQKQSLIQGAVLNPDLADGNLQAIRALNKSLVETHARDAAHATMENQNVAQQFAVARLKFMPAAQQVAALQPLMDQAQGTPNAAPPTDASAANSNLPSTSDSAIPYVMNRFEGSQLVENDNGHGPSRYGIVASANGLSPQQVANLSPQAAMQIYKTNYWDKIGADNLPANMRLAAFDTAVQFGPDTAQKMITAADGDPQKLLDLRAQTYQNLVTQNPDKYGASAPAWASRQQLLGQALDGTDKKNVTDWTQMLPPERLPELYAQAQQGVRADFVDQERIQKMQQDQVKGQQEQSMNGYLNQALDGKLSAEEIKNDQILTFEQREKMLNMMHTVANRGEQTDPKTFIDLFNRIHAAPGDPSKITNPEDLNAYVGNGIGYQDVLRLRGELQGKNTPDGDAEAKMRDQTFKAVRGMVSGADEGLGIKDPKGDEIYAHAMNLMYKAIQDGKDKGTPADQLYDPQSPNWVGNVAKGLKRPDSQWYSDLNGANGEGGAGMMNLTTPQALVAAVTAGKMTRADGEALALKNGWIRANAPAVPLAGQ